MFFVACGVMQRVSYTEKYLRALLNTANTVEFEWIRQYYVQGAKHRETHLYWEGAMQELVELWTDMTRKTVLALGVLRDAAGRYSRSNIRKESECVFYLSGIHHTLPGICVYN